MSTSLIEQHFSFEPGETRTPPLCKKVTCLPAFGWRKLLIKFKVTWTEKDTGQSRKSKKILDFSVVLEFEFFFGGGPGYMIQNQPDNQ